MPEHVSRAFVIRFEYQRPVTIFRFFPHLPTGDDFWEESENGWYKAPRWHRMSMETIWENQSGFYVKESGLQRIEEIWRVTITPDREQDDRFAGIPTYMKIVAPQKDSSSFILSFVKKMEELGTVIPSRIRTKLLDLEVSRVEDQYDTSRAEFRGQLHKSDNYTIFDGMEDECHVGLDVYTISHNENRTCSSPPITHTCLGESGGGDQIWLSADMINDFQRTSMYVM